jgi:phosphoglycolate phosphatase-like HAD superfamily hydrolase
VERGAARLGVAAAGCRVVVIGDTPRDITAARAIGAACVAVATGSYSVEALRTHQPELAVPTMADPKALRLLLGDA